MLPDFSPLRRPGDFRLVYFGQAISGFGTAMTYVVLPVQIYQTIPARLRGRTAAIEMASYMTGPYLGNAEAGFAARLLGLGPSVIAGGALCVLGSVVIAWALPEFRAYDALPAEPAASAPVVST